MNNLAATAAMLAAFIAGVIFAATAIGSNAAVSIGDSIAPDTLRCSEDSVIDHTGPDTLGCVHIESVHP